jgi:hypothetical protein
VTHLANHETKPARSPGYCCHQAFDAEELIDVERRHGWVENWFDGRFSFVGRFTKLSLTALCILFIIGRGYDMISLVISEGLAQKLLIGHADSHREAGISERSAGTVFLFPLVVVKMLKVYY